ncbi:hypothetical protein I656_01779 [Geobacillus sp. WSUCF1]|nr:hypothetical protein I656_01779 [Geobacillus sp. WSUCF1]
MAQFACEHVSMYLLVISNLHYIRFSVQKGKKNTFYTG